MISRTWIHQQEIFESYYNITTSFYVKLRTCSHLKESLSNTSYLSPDIQNELIILIGEEILSSLFSKVKDASCFAVIADETTDKSIKVSWA